MVHKYPYTDFNEYNLDWVIERVKQLTADWLETAEQWTNTEEEWNTLYNYVHDYFDNLDVTQEVGQIINDYRLDGTLTTICQPIVDHWVETNVPNQINEWLDTNITQETGYVLDSSLTLSNAAAPAKTVGDALTDIDDSLEPFIDEYADFSVNGSFTNYSDGTFATGQGNNNKRTDYIDLTYISKIVYCVEGYTTVIATIAFYDADKTYLKSISRTGGGYTVQTIDLTDDQYADAKYVVISSHGWTSEHADSIYAQLIKTKSINVLYDTVQEDVSSVSWSKLPLSILRKMDFIGVSPEKEPYPSLNFQIQNLIGDGSIISAKHSIAGTRYLSNNGVTITNTELNWSKSLSVHSLCDFDYDGIFVLYDKSFSPKDIIMIGIAKNGATFTDAEKDIIGDIFKLSAFRDGYYSTSGVIKFERPLSKKTYANLILNPAFTSNSNWTLGAGWSISNGMAACNDSGIARDTLSQSVTLTGGKKYKVGFKLEAVTSGSIELYIDEELISDAVSVNTYYEYDYIPDGSGNVQETVSFKPTDNSAFVGKISFVELTEE